MTRFAELANAVGKLLHRHHRCVPQSDFLQVARALADSVAVLEAHGLVSEAKLRRNQG